MQPFYQGKIDNFCAIYAVLNAMQILHGISPGQAREVFNVVLLKLSKNEKAFQGVLRHQVDYIELVDAMFVFLGNMYTFNVQAPFARDENLDAVWDALECYAHPEKKRTAVFRFIRYKAFRKAPVADHWTTAGEMDARGLNLFDCSLESGGLYHMSRCSLSRTTGVPLKDSYYIPPESVRLLSAT